MKNYLLILILLSFLSCGKIKSDKQKKQVGSSVVTSSSIEKFEYKDVSQLNAKISKTSDITSAIDIMQMYYPTILGMEGKEEITISEKISNGNIKVTLIHDYMPDDSVRAEKHIMELKRADHNKWTVLFLKNNWRCQPRRGHNKWGIELCK